MYAFCCENKSPWFHWNRFCFGNIPSGYWFAHRYMHNSWLRLFLFAMYKHFVENTHIHAHINWERKRDIGTDKEKERGACKENRTDTKTKMYSNPISQMVSWFSILNEHTIAPTKYTKHGNIVFYSHSEYFAYQTIE